jgi:DNA-directed RNA polymerase II subunit RPB1
VRNQQAQKLAHVLKIKLEYKQENLKQIIAYKYQFEYSRKDECVPDEVDGLVVMTPRTEISNCLDVYFDEVKSIEEIPNTTNYAYDLTIEDTRNFNIYNGLCLRDTFHFAGVSSKSNVTRGVPRIEEILSLSSEPKNPLLTVYLKPEDETDRAKAQSIMYMLEHTNMREVVQSVDLCFDPDELSTLIEEDQTTMEQYKRVEDILKECAEDDTADETVKSKWVIRMEMDAEVMLEKNITMDDIHFTLNHSFGNEISCIYSDYNASKLVFRIRMNEVLSTSRNGQKKTKIASLDQSDQIYVLKNFQEQMLDNVVLRGIKGIEKVVLRKIKDNVVETAGAFKQQEIWVLDGIGTNMLDVLALDYIDNTRTYSNHIIEIFNILGIEAARQAIYNELVEVLEFDSAYINFHHLSLLCDRMTYTYKLISIFRHGINNDNIGPIAKASFEETPKIFLDAAQHADLDIMRGISANVMCGQEGFYGTSAFQVILDIAEMTKQQAAQVKLSNENDELEKLLSGMAGAEEVNACSTESLTIKNDVANIKSVQLGEDNDYNPGF